MEEFLLGLEIWKGSGIFIKISATKNMVMEKYDLGLEKGLEKVRNFDSESSWQVGYSLSQPSEGGVGFTFRGM